MLSIRISINHIFMVFSLFIAFNSYSATVYINEILASNTAYYAGNTEYTDWIEIYNDGASPLDLSGHYLTDDKTNRAKWIIPSGTSIAAKSYKIFYTDNRNTGLHTSFKLNVQEGFIGLYNPQQAVVDTFTYKSQRNNISYGRSSSNLLLLGYFQTPTPATGNGSITYTEMTGNPVFSLQGGFYASAQTLTITASVGSTVRYTTNGTEPTSTSTLYSGPIPINSIMCIRAVAFQSGLLNSNTITNTYFINVNKTLPVVSIVTDPDNFFSDETGIYVIGTNGIQAGCSPTPMNLNQEWERPVNIELYDEDGVMRLNQGAGVRIFGGCSRQRFPIKSLEVFARKQYGKGDFDYKIFKSRNFDSYESFLIRSSSDDQQQTMFRDALGQTLASDLEVETQAYQPVVVYINGQYWGIQNLREKYNEAYFKDHFGVEETNVNLVQNNKDVKIGSATHYQSMLNYVRLHKNDANIYEYMNTQMDIESYIDYYATQIYLGADDWPGNNIKYWRATTGNNNRWRWVCYDMDQVVMNNNTRWNSMLLATTPYNGNSWPNPPWSVELFNNLLAGSKFKYEFINRVTFLMNTAFAPVRIVQLVDSMQDNIAAEMPYHIARWGGQLVDDPSREGWIQPLPNSMAAWEGKVQVMRNFASSRPDTTINMLQQFFNLSPAVGMTINHDLSMGYLYMGPKLITEAVHKGKYFPNIPMILKAAPKPGYRFVRWEVTPSGSTTSQYTSAVLSFSPTKTSIIKAVFEEYSMEGPVIVINEINYHSSNFADAGDWAELYNRTPDSVDISGWILKDNNVDHYFKVPDDIILPVGGYFVLCQDKSMFEIQYPDITNYTGNFEFGLGNGGDCLKLYNAQMLFIDSVNYSDNTPWPFLADGYGNTLSLISTDYDNDLAENWTDGYVATPGMTNGMTGIDEPFAEANLWLNQNYPNPCSDNTSISYGLNSAGEVSLIIYNLLGEQVKTVVNEYQSANIYTISMRVDDLPSGTYFYTLRLGHNQPVTKMMIIK